eukprot:gene14927-biopygen9200
MPRPPQRSRSATASAADTQGKGGCAARSELVRSCVGMVLVEVNDAIVNDVHTMDAIVAGSFVQGSASIKLHFRPWDSDAPAEELLVEQQESTQPHPPPHPQRLSQELMDILSKTKLLAYAEDLRRDGLTTLNDIAELPRPSDLPRNIPDEDRVALCRAVEYAYATVPGPAPAIPHLLKLLHKVGEQGDTKSSEQPTGRGRT